MNPFPESPLDIGTALFIIILVIGGVLFWYGVAIVVSACL